MPTAALDPHRPWRTAPQQWAIVVRLMVFVAVAQFILQGINNVVGGLWMLVLWVAAGIVTSIATVRIEKYFAKRGGFLP